MSEHDLHLTALPIRLAVCRLDANARVPEWSLFGTFHAITRTEDELSVVCADANVPDDVSCSRGWACLKVAGPLDLSLVGVLSDLAAPLAGAGISILAVSTYDTDYFLVKERDLPMAAEALREAGFHVD